MKICCRKVAMFLALLPGCLALVTRHHQTTNKPVPFTSSTKELSSWDQKAKHWTAAGMLGVSLILGTNVNPATAATTEKTTIEVTVETDYLVRALDYLGGDMKKTMTAIVRAPTSTLKINPPESARDDLLRALYPFGEPEEYAEQINWLGISVQPKKSIVELLTGKQFKLGPVGFSLIDAGLVGIVFSYAWGFKVYEDERMAEEAAAAAKKAAMQAKKAKAAAAAAAAEKAKMAATE